MITIHYILSSHLILTTSTGILKNILFHFNTKRYSDTSKDVEILEPLDVAMEEQSVVLQKLNRVIINPRILPLSTYPKELKLIFQINTRTSTATLIVRAEDGSSLNTPPLMSRQTSIDNYIQSSAVQPQKGAETKILHQGRRTGTVEMTLLT